MASEIWSCSENFRLRQVNGYDRAAAGPVGEREPAAVRCDDLATESEAEAGAGGLRGEGGQQCIAQHLLREAGAAIGDFDQKALGARVDADSDGIGWRAGLGGILQEVDHDLLELPDIE